MLGFELVLVLYLTTWNCNTGELLEETPPQIREDLGFSLSGDIVEDCRIYGVDRGYEMTAKWKSKGYDNVTTQVKCWWERSKIIGD